MRSLAEAAALALLLAELARLAHLPGTWPVWLVLAAAVTAGEFARHWLRGASRTVHLEPGAGDERDWDVRQE
jgi:hypothetical protein